MPRIKLEFPNASGELLAEHIADRCPVHRTLESDPVITSQLADE